MGEPVDTTDAIHFAEDEGVVLTEDILTFSNTARYLPCLRKARAYRDRSVYCKKTGKELNGKIVCKRNRGGKCLR